MERFSIVRIRIDCSSAKQQKTDSHLREEKELIKKSSGTLNKICECAWKGSQTRESPMQETDDAISIDLTPELCNLLESNRCVKYFLDGDASTGVSLDLQRHAEGHIIFNFQFKKVDTVKTA